MNEPVTVRYDLVEVLKELKQDIKGVNTKLDKQSEKLNTIEVNIATLTEKVDGMDKRVEKVEGTQKNQVWTLIGILATAILGLGVAVTRFFFTTNP
ncbi:MAG: hemolysin XhlA family protein [Crocosphaera sp.]|nr:hemolysin XhlA family protein [Crocosphaera sp.]